MQLRQHGDHFRLDLTEVELNAFHSGLAETLEALEDWELQTRTGLQREEMRSILVDLRNARRKLTEDALSDD